METTQDPRVSRLVVVFLRFYAGMTQADFGKASGVNQGDVSRYESDSNPKSPTEETLRRMARAARLPWPLVVHLRRFYSVLLAAADRRTAIESGAEILEGRLAEPALLAMSAYLTEEAPAEPSRRQRLEQTRREAAEVFTGLERLPASRRRRTIELSLRSSRSWWAALEAQVCDASVRAAANRPAEALELARLALFIVERSEVEEGWRRRMMGYAWGHIANAHRVGNRLADANAAFVRAWALWRAGTPSDSELLPEWRLLDLEASLRREERRFPQALELLDRALATSRGNTMAAGRILLKKGFVLEQMGDIEGALGTLGEATPHIEASADPRLLYCLRFETAKDLAHLEHYAEAAAVLPWVRELAEQQADELSLLRVEWLEARVAAGQGKTDEAVAGLNHVRERFTGLHLPYDAALAALDLAILWLEAGRTAEVRELAVAMEKIFNANGIDREALAALSLFCEAAKQETATVGLVRRVMSEIERVRRSSSTPGKP